MKTEIMGYYHPADTCNHVEEPAPEEALQEVTTFVFPPNI